MNFTTQYILIIQYTSIGRGALLSHYKAECLGSKICVATRRECAFLQVSFSLEGGTFLMPENLEKEVEMQEIMQGLIGAIIAFIGVVLSVSISLFVSLKTNRYDYNRLFAKTVSESRNKWLNEMRDFISTMLAEVKEPTPTAKYWKARYEILLRLNMTEELHKALANEIETLDCNNNRNKEQTITNIISLSQLILKDEWETVKKEARGK